MPFNPKVSIIIPVYNGSNYLKEAIDSALAQTYKNIEIIVVNDGSTDNGATEKIAKSYGSKITYYKKENGGVATALNLGIQKMTGDYFSWLSHDDTYKPYKVEKQIQYLSTHKDRRVVLYSDYELMDENGRPYEQRIQDHAMLEKTPINALFRGIVNGITILVPKAAFEEYGDFDPTLWCTQDYDMWYRIFKGYPFVHLPEILSNTRIHDNQDTLSNPRVLTEGNALWIRMIKDLPTEDKIKAEGSVLNFYFETAKFIKYTPYTEAIDYTQQQLEQAAQSKETAAFFAKTIDDVASLYTSLVVEGQKRVAGYFIENVVKELVRIEATDQAVRVLRRSLISDNAGLSDAYIAEHYTTKVGERSKKPRILFWSSEWLTGGMERVMSILFRQLKDDYEIFLLTSHVAEQGKITIPDFVTHIKMSTDDFWNSFDHIAFSHALTLDIDIAVGFLNLFKSQLSFYELCAGTRIKTVASNHEIYFYPYSNSQFFDVIQKRLDAYSHVNAALWLTNFSAAAYGLARDNSYLMPNPNTYKVHSTTSTTGEEIILCVGRFNDYIKRVDRMLRCFSIVSKQRPDARLVLVGKYDRKMHLASQGQTVDELIKSLKIDESRISFEGERANLEDYYSRASVLLLTSVNEGFGMVINEAASFGVPTVANKIPGLEDLITDGKNGFLVEQDDIEAMAEAVTKILSEKKTREMLSKNALIMATRFDEVEIAKRWRYLFSTLLGGISDEATQLRKKLGYQIADQNEFSKALFRQLNNTIDTSITALAALRQPPEPFKKPTLVEKSTRHYTRIMNVIKSEGVLRTGVLVAKKTHTKARKIYKRQ